MKFDVKKLETSLCRTLWKVFRHLELFRRESRVWQTDRQTIERTDKMVISNRAL